MPRAGGGRGGGAPPPDRPPGTHRGIAQGKGEPPMADEAQTIRGINWRDAFPFTQLFKAFRVAVHPSKLVLALTALLLLYFGGRVLDGLWLDKHLVHDTADNYGFYRPDRTNVEDAGNPRGIFISFFEFEVDRVNDVVQGVLMLSPER